MRSDQIYDGSSYIFNKKETGVCRVQTAFFDRIIRTQIDLWQYAAPSGKKPYLSIFQNPTDGFLPDDGSMTSTLLNKLSLSVEKAGRRADCEGPLTRQSGSRKARLVSGLCTLSAAAADRVGPIWRSAEPSTSILPTVTSTGSRLSIPPSGVSRSEAVRAPWDTQTESAESAGPAESAAPRPSGRPGTHRRSQPSHLAQGSQPLRGVSRLALQ